tara:strand:+ start:1904 stop:2638 length:735 start_codon:yes stop_codon:yes gene_type:complete
MQAMAAMGLRAVRSAARELARAFDRPDLVEVIGDGTYTNAERDAEADIRNSLQHTYPDHGFGAGSGAEFTWWIKAVEGSANFARNLPHFAVVVVCLQKGRPQHAVVVDPMRDEEFVGSRGGGCRMNGTQLLRVSGRAHLREAMVGLRTFRPGLNAALEDADCQIRRSGSAALDLAYVAAGRLDAAVLAGANAAAVAAGSLLIAEAGGLVSNFEGGSADPASGAAVAGTRGVFRELLPLARKSYG